MRIRYIIFISIVSFFIAGCIGSNSNSQTEIEKFQGWGASSDSLVQLETNEQLEERINTSSEILSFLSSTINQEDSENYDFQNVIYALKEDENIIGVEVSDDELHILDKTGGRLNIPLVFKHGDKLVDITEPYELEERLDTNGSNSVKTYLLKRPESQTVEKDVFPDYPVKNALIYMPYLGNWNESDTIVACAMKYYFEKSNYAVDFITDKNINKLIGVDETNYWHCNVSASAFKGDGIDTTISYLNNLDEYAAVYIGTHGGENSIHTGIVIDDSQIDNTTVSLFSKSLGVELGRNMDDTWLRTGLGSDPNLVLTSEFFTIKPSDYFKNSIFQIDACKTGKGSKFADSVINAGASVFIGFTDNITVTSSIDFTIPLYERLSKGNSLQEALTTPSILKQNWIFQEKYKPTVNIATSEIDDTFFLDEPLSTDSTAPVISLNGSPLVRVLINQPYVDEGATAEDDIDGSVDVTIYTDSVNTSVLGTYSVVFTATDAAGNTETTTRKVIVEGELVSDTTAPVISLNGSALVRTIINQSYVDEGATANDDFDGSVDVIVNADNVNTSELGTYSVTFTATDTAGNTETTTRKVIVEAAPVIDTTPPVISLIGSVLVRTTINQTYEDEGATALDDVDGSLTVTINVDNVNTSELGTYTVVFTATDSAGNTQSTTRKIIVEAVEEPESLILEEFNGDTVSGNDHGITYESSPFGQAAVFARSNESRVQFPYSTGFPKEGTIELLIKVDNAYNYRNYALNDDQDCALIFTTDIQGGDVSWPGSAWVTACKNGDVHFTIKQQKYESGFTLGSSLTASNTSFKFGEWHSVAFSFGSQGKYISVDGGLYASDATQTQILGAGGNHSSPVDHPTIGESVSGFWSNNQYEGGFEGAVDRFRVSDKQKDWYLSQ